MHTKYSCFLNYLLYCCSLSLRTGVLRGIGKRPHGVQLLVPSPGLFWLVLLAVRVELLAEGLGSTAGGRRGARGGGGGEAKRVKIKQSLLVPRLDEDYYVEM